MKTIANRNETDRFALPESAVDPTELTDEQLDAVRGGTSAGPVVYMTIKMTDVVISSF